MSGADFAAAFAAGQSAATPRTVTADGYAVIPANSTLADLEAYLQAPRRIRSRVIFADAAAFIAYVQKHKGADTMVLGARENGTVTAVLDYHGAGKPAWGQHIAILHCKPSEAWSQWAQVNKKWQGQVDFAEFLESNAKDIVEPTPATMMELALTFQAKRDLTFGKGIRLASGQVQLHYQEEMSASAGAKGEVVIPEVFKLGLAPFEGCAAYAVETRLKWRIKDGDVVFSTDMLRAEDIRRTAFQGIMDRVRDETSLPVWLGALN